ncbi:MAG TPA: SMP-30/gluconolactonase/LRE family protein, partial [Anaerolineales bacterium]
AWCERDGLLYWVDIWERRVYAGDEVLLQLDDYVGCLAPRRDGGLILTQSDGFYEWDARTHSVERMVAVEEPRGRRFNDGKCDPAGRFLAGCMDNEEKEACGTLYSLAGRHVTPLLGGLSIPNGLTWSPDGKTFYFIDTPSRQVRAYEYDLSTGQIPNGRTVISVPEELGWPDGMTSDTEGNLWIAMWGGAQVTQWDPADGRLLQSIPVPALQTSSCIFGGPNLNELYITSARTGMNREALQKYPLSGGLFKLVTGVTGSPTYEFASIPE